MNKNEIFKIIQRLAVLKGAPVTTERAMMYTEFLAQFDSAKIIQALEECALELKFFPDISDIAEKIEKIQGGESPVEIAAKIMQAVRTYGNAQQDQAREYLGETAWGIADRYGWFLLCDSKVDSSNYILGKLESLAKSMKPKLDYKAIMRTVLVKNGNTAIGGDDSHKRISITQGQP